MQSMDTESLYDENATKWARREPSSLSDFTGRPAVFSLCGDVSGLDVLDLGCGEGYCSRELMSRGAKSMLGIELSAEMVEIARQQESTLQQGITFEQGNAALLGEVPSDGVDLVTAVFLYNYMTVEQTHASFAEVHRVLRAGGAFVFSVPHPALGFIRTRHEAPFYFNTLDAGYFTGVDHQFQGEIWRRDGTRLPVQMIHKTLVDYLDGLREAGFTAMPEMRELGVLPEHMDLDPAFFGGVNDVPLHLAVRVQKA